MDVSLRLLQSWTGREKVNIEKVASGIALIIWDPMRRQAASCHFFSRDETKIEGKIVELINSLGVDGANVSNLRAKIVGGADVAGLQIGKKFAISVVNILKKLGIPIGGYDIGGNVTRNVSFDPVTGRCIVSYLIGGSREV